jgi:hypothetical protein
MKLEHKKEEKHFSLLCFTTFNTETKKIKLNNTEGLWMKLSKHLTEKS